MRWVLGPIFDSVTRKAPPSPTPPGSPPKLDPGVTLNSVDADTWTVNLSVPSYDLATHNRLAEVRVYLVPSGYGRPADGPGYVDSNYPFAPVDLRDIQGGADVSIPLPEVDPGDYFGQVVQGYDDSPDPGGDA